MFWNDPELLQHDGLSGNVNLPLELRGFLSSSRNVRARSGVEARTFSNARIEAVHQQLREAESIQAISRLRLIHKRHRKRVFILSNVPLEIPVDQLTKFDDLIPDRLKYEFLKAGNIPLALLGLLKLRPDLAANTDLIHRAGLKRGSGARSGIVTLIQRFGSALNLNTHLHMIVLDGDYTVGESGKANFHRVKAPNQTELRTLLNRVIQRVVRRLEREGLLIPDPEQPWLDLDFHEPIDSLSAASVRYRIATGPHSGSRTLRLHDPSLIRTDRPTKASTADRDGFPLNAAMSCQSYQRDRLERLCRYVTRPAICLERLAVRADGQIQYGLKNPFSDGTTHILFSPLDFLSKLAALVPRPRHNLVRYHGIFAPNSKMRKLILPKSSKRMKGKQDSKTDKTYEEATSQDELIAPLSWAQRLKRVFNIDITLCPICGGTMRVIADITDPDIILKILDHLEPQPPPIKPVTAIQS